MQLLIIIITHFNFIGNISLTTDAIGHYLAPPVYLLNVYKCRFILQWDLVIYLSFF